MTGRGLHHSRRRVPTALKKLRGTIEKSRDTRHRQFEPKPEGDLSSEPPPWMGDEAQAAYRYALAHAPRGLLKATDRGALVVWCTAETRHRMAVMAQARLDAGRDWPMLQPGQHGRPTISPYIKIAERAALAMLRCADVLGFTPASRPRIALVPGAALPPVIDGEAELDHWEALGRLHRRDVA